MNSRSSVNESNLVDFTADLTNFNQLDTKDGLLTFPFDHIYACHSDSSDRRPTLDLDKEVEISTHCVVSEDKDLVLGTSSEITRLTDKLSAAEDQNKRLKDLLVYHLDLIQQQNDIITKREKFYQALKQENDTLKVKLNRRLPSNQRQSLNPPPLLQVQSPITSPVIKTEPSSQLMLADSFSELLLPDSRTNSFIYDGDINKNTTFGQEGFPVKSANTDISYLPSVTSFLDNNYNSNSTYTMIESKRSFVKKEMKSESRPEPLYTVTSNSGHPVIQRIQRNSRRSTGIGSMSRMARRAPTATKTEADCKATEENTTFDHTFTVNKKNKMINTYSKSKNSAKKTMSQYSGSLTDRLQLIDKTPTGVDPYQLGEADLREQSPIPKLMLAKTKNARLRRAQAAAETSTSGLLLDEPADANGKGVTKVNLDRFSFPTYSQDAKEAKAVLIAEPDLELVKTESSIDWSVFANKTPGTETSLCDFSYGETSNNLATNILPTLDFQELFANDASLNFDLNSVEFSIDESSTDKSKKRAARTTSLIAPPPPFGEGTAASALRGTDSKRGGRKRAFSTNAKGMKREPAQKGIMAKPKMTKGKSMLKVKKAPPPGIVSKKRYHTSVGDPDLSWYLGLDPDLKMEDVDPTGETQMSTVEVPRWREKSVTSCYSLEGTENLDDKIFEKRHQKLELEERRQLRWHMRRVREQRHVERLRLRQRDSWPASQQPPPAFTIWPRPQRDCKYIEITNRLPVMALGEVLPDLPPVDFTLPWVRTSKAQKRSKRAKTTPH